MSVLPRAAGFAALIALSVAGCELIGTNMSETFTEIQERLAEEERRRQAEATGSADTDAPASATTDEDASGKAGASDEAGASGEPGASGEAGATGPARASSDPAETAPTTTTSTSADEPTPKTESSGATQDLTARCAGMTERPCRAHRACTWTDQACVPAPPQRR